MWIIALTMLLGGTLRAQDIVGDWQGTLLRTGKEFRTVLHITRSDNGGWEATLYSIDQGPEYGGPEGMPVTSLTLQGSDFEYSVDSIHGTYAGKLCADGAAIVGTWTQNDKRIQLDFQRATKATAFEDGLPSARVVLLPNASHFVFQSNAADVIREMNAFLGSLP